MGGVADLAGAFVRRVRETPWFVIKLNLMSTPGDHALVPEDALRKEFCYWVHGLGPFVGVIRIGVEYANLRHGVSETRRYGGVPLAGDDESQADACCQRHTKGDEDGLQDGP